MMMAPENKICSYSLIERRAGKANGLIATTTGRCTPKRIRVVHHNSDRFRAVFHPMRNL